MTELDWENFMVIYDKFDTYIYKSYDNNILLHTDFKELVYNFVNQEPYINKDNIHYVYATEEIMKQKHFPDWLFEME